MKNINKLVDKSLLIEKEEAFLSHSIGYMARALVQATIPHSRPNKNEFTRCNGSFKLTIIGNPELGLPYGSIPRLLILWITTEVAKTKKRELTLGKNLSEFLKALGLKSSGGKNGSITRLKDQMKRLFSASIYCTYDDGNHYWGVRNITPIQEADLWWSPRDPNQITTWKSKLLLGESFFAEIINNPIPVDVRVLNVLRQSPMAIDIYCWLTYRMSYLNRITNIPWEVLEMQFGADYGSSRQFKKKFLNQLKKVLIVYPEARVKEANSKLVLLPSKPHIKKCFLNSNNRKEKKRRYTEKELDIEYKKYKLNKIIEVVNNIADEKEKHMIFCEYDTFLDRTNAHKIRSLIVKGDYTDDVKESLYNFIDSNWHHILENFKSYDQFCSSFENQ